MAAIQLFAKSKLQKCVAISTMEAELYALTELTKEMSWINKISREIGFYFSQPINLFTDNQSTIKFINNTSSMHVAKHIKTKFHLSKKQSTTMKLL